MPYLRLNSFQLSLLLVQRFDKILKQYSLKSRWTSTPQFIILKITSTSPELLKDYLKKSNFEACKIVFKAANLRLLSE